MRDCDLLASESSSFWGVCFVAGVFPQVVLITGRKDSNPLV
jgi:hypothetical protein